MSAEGGGGGGGGGGGVARRRDRDRGVAADHDRSSGVDGSARPSAALSLSVSAGAPALSSSSSDGHALLRHDDYDDADDEAAAGSVRAGRRLLPASDSAAGSVASLGGGGDADADADADADVMAGADAVDGDAGDGHMDEATAAMRDTNWPWYRLLAFSLFWFGISVVSAGLLVIVLPSQVLAAFPEGSEGHDNIGSMLAGLVGTGAVINALLMPLFGYISDTHSTRFGRRRPFMVIGVCGMCVGFLLMAFSSSAELIALLFIGNIVQSTFQAMLMAPYSALIPDCVPPEQRGRASGWMGVMTMLGFGVSVMGIGILVTIVSYPVMYAILGGTLVLSMFATLFSFRDPHVPQVARWRKPARRVCCHMVKPFCFAPFTWVVVTRSLNVMGMYTVQEFLLYYFTDIGAPYPIAGAELQSPALATALVTMTLLVGAAIISLPSGWLSDRIGRRAICMIAAVVQGIVALVVGYVYDFQMFLGLGVVFGFGYGAFVSVEWGLASDVLPSTREHAKDIGVWHLSLTVPQALATPIGGLIRDKLQEYGDEIGVPMLGYKAIFTLSTFYFVLGSLLMLCINMKRVHALRARNSRLKQPARDAVAAESPSQPGESAADVEHARGGRDDQRRRPVSHGDIELE